MSQQKGPNKARSHERRPPTPRHAGAWRPHGPAEGDNGAHQVGDVAPEALVGHVVLLAADEVADVLGQVLPIGQRRHMPCAPDQHRDDHDLARQCPGYLLAHVVGPSAGGPRLELLQPARADDRDEHVAGAERRLQLLVEDLARQQVLDVHEDVGAAEPGGQPVAELARVSGNVIAAVADENLVRHQIGAPLSAKCSEYP